MSDTGRVRDENEDAFGTFTEEASNEHLFIVADGMGGHTRGREASTTAVDVVKATYFKTKTGSVLDRLRQAFHAANRRIYELSMDETGPGSMGTTATALALTDGHAFLAHLGDSQAYRFRKEGSQKLTRDHTVVEEMLREGLISEEDARTHPRRGTLTKAIGTEASVDPDVIDVGPVHQEDRFLICSDGLSDLPDHLLHDIVMSHRPQTACEKLVAHANEKGGYDNSTALVICGHPPQEAKDAVAEPS